MLVERLAPGYNHFGIEQLCPLSSALLVCNGGCSSHLGRPTAARWSFVEATPTSAKLSIVSGIRE